jgi:hypothetical protein
MPKYKCLNPECRNFDKIEVKSTTIRVENGKVIDSAKRCYYCNSDMDSIPEPGMTTYMTGSKNICKK